MESTSNEGILPSLASILGEREAELLSLELRLIRLDQRPYSLRVGLAMAVTGYRICSARGFDANLRPDHTRRDVHGCHLRHGNRFFVAAKKSSLHAAYA